MATVEERGTYSGKMPYEVFQVPEHVVPVLWPTAFALLWREKEFFQRIASSNFCFQLIMQRKMQLWVMCDEEDMKLAMLTEVRGFDKEKQVNVLCLGGKNLKSAMAIYWDCFTLWARREGATSISFVGRPGLARVLKRLGFKSDEKVFALADISHVKEH